MSDRRYEVEARTGLYPRICQLAFYRKLSPAHLSIEDPRDMLIGKRKALFATDFMQIITSLAGRSI